MNTHTPTPEDFIALLDELRQMGYHIGADQYIAVNDLLLALAAQGLLPCPRQKLRNWLAPILCTSPTEQEIFYQYFDQWLNLHPHITATFTEDEQSGELKPQRPRLPIHRERVETIIRRSRPWHWVAAGLMILTAVALLLVLTNRPPALYVLPVKVVTSENEPIRDAKVSFLDQTAFTNETGVFSFTYQETKESQAKLLVTHGSYSKEHMVELNREYIEPLTIRFENGPTPPVTTGVVTDASAQQTLNGSVLDSEDNQPVIGAQVSFLQQTVSTNSAGEFSFTYQARDGQARLVVTHPNYETVERQVDTSPVIIKMSPSIVTLSELKEWVRIYQHYFKWLRRGAMVLPFLIFGIWWAWWMYRRRMILQRHSATQIPQLDRIVVEDKTRSLFQGAAFRRTAQKLRRHREVGSSDLDAEATVEATVQKGGWFTPIYGFRQVLPEYLVLIDRLGFRDHQARFVDEIVDQLIADGIFVTRYYFDGDPRDCWSEDPFTPHLTIQELATRYPDHRLMFFTDGSGFMNPLTGEPNPWLQLFKPWADRAIFTPERVDQWGYREWALSGLDFVVLPASQVGLAVFIETIHLGRTPQLDRDKWSSPYPEMLQERPGRWLEQREPEPEVIERLCAQLEYFLGEEAYYWFSACAVYPILSWGLYCQHTSENSLRNWNKCFAACQFLLRYDNRILR